VLPVQAGSAGVPCACRLTAVCPGWLPLPPTALTEEEIPSCKAHVIQGRQLCNAGHERLLAQPQLRPSLTLALLVRQWFISHMEEIKSVHNEAM